MATFPNIMILHFDRDTFALLECFLHCSIILLEIKNKFLGEVNESRDNLLALFIDILLEFDLLLRLSKQIKNAVAVYHVDRHL